MTLIAALELDGTPFIFGDLLISEPNNQGPHAPLPTILNTNALLPREEWWPRVTRLERKIAKINEWLAVAWTGDRIMAKTVITELRRRYKAKRISSVQLSIFFKEMTSETTLNCTIMGWLIEKENLLSFEWNSNDSQTNFGGNYAAGSGASSFEYQINNYTKFVFQDENSSISREYSPPVMAVMICGNIVGREIHTGETIRALYGGGMEVLYINNNRFIPVEPITYTFWNASITNNVLENLRFVPLIIRSQYWRDYIVIRTFRYPPKPPRNGLDIPRVDYYIVTPIYDDETEDLKAISTINFIKRVLGDAINTNQTGYYCNYIVKKRNGHTRSINCLAVRPVNNDDDTLFPLQLVPSSRRAYEEMGMKNEITSAITAIVEWENNTSD